jgi:hypothetical protein
MLRVRTTKTASGATAVQIVSYDKGKTVVHHHVGSAHNKEALWRLCEQAEIWLATHAQQTRLFRDALSPIPERVQYLRTTHVFARDVLLACFRFCGLDVLREPILLDLALMRLIEPASKLRTLELLNRYFGVTYAYRSVGRALHRFVKKKDAIERIAFSFAKKSLNEPFALVLYDVTTLYFESFKADNLRIQGFSKDNKHIQPQIVIGLLVTASGFPVAWEVFKGNTFEGHTMLPVLTHFAEVNKVSLPVIVADAAMLSKTNLADLRTEGISYIVGARLGNTSFSFIKDIAAALDRTDEKTVRLAYRKEAVVCAFSKKRYRKDKRELEKQIEKARALVARNESGRRAKFVKKSSDNVVVFDDALREKSELLLGIKGYVTNISEKKLDNTEVITSYHNLWRVEESFRMSKHDISARPIFHRVEDAVRAHVLTCFVALMIGKYLELSTGLSIRKIRDLLWNVTEAHIKDTVTGEVFVLRSPLDEVVHSQLRRILKKVGFTY